MIGIVERLRFDATRCEIQFSKGVAGNISEGADEIERLRGCLAAIQKATIDGRVCDDVAWFDQITTLHDFCDQALNR